MTWNHELAKLTVETAALNKKTVQIIPTGAMLSLVERIYINVKNMVIDRATAVFINSKQE